MKLNKNKQIDEIAKLICTYPQCIHYNNIGGCATTECQTVDIAENLYKQGYRKTSDVAREIFAEIEEIIARNTTKDFPSNTDSEIKLKFEQKSGMIESVYPEMRVTGYNGRQIVRLIDELKKKYESEGTK